MNVLLFRLLRQVALLACGACLATPAYAEVSLPPAYAGVPYAFQVTTTPAASPGSTYSATGLPSGLAIGNATGLITGTPAAAGASSGTIAVTYGTVTSNYPYTLAVSAANWQVNPTGVSSGTLSSVFPSQFLGARFNLATGARIVAVQGEFGPSTYGTLFAALIPLSSMSAIPTGNVTSGTAFAAGEVIASTVFTVPMGFTNPVVVPITLDVPPGVYGVVFGTSHFGATGSGSMPAYGSATGASSFSWVVPPSFVPTWQNLLSSHKKIGLATAPAAPLPAIAAISPPRQVVNTGQSLTLSVTASGATTYQWRRNGRPIAGATSATYTMASAGFARDAGWYQVVVGNNAGSVTSAVVFVNVVVGRVVAWGDNTDGQTNVPANLAGITAISAGFSHSLALKADGTVVAWGANGFGQSNVPSGLSDVVAIAAANSGSIALKSNGTLVAWGNVAVPAGATDVVAIAADYHTLAVKANGTVLAAGNNDFGQLNIPAGLTGVVAVAAGGNGSLALREDGNVVVWGSNLYGQAGLPAGLAGVIGVANADRGYALKSDGTVAVWGAGLDVGQTRMPNGQAGVTAIAACNVGSSALLTNGTVATWGVASPPAGLNNIVGIAEGTSHMLALQDVAFPVIVSPPASVATTSGQPATLSVTATGGTGVTYQWRRGGFAIPGATNASYTIATASRSDAGLYDVAVSDGAGTALSQPAWLTVAPAQTIDFLVPDPSFNPRLEWDLAGASSWVDLPGGGVLVGGNFTSIGSTARPYLARLTAAGAVDTTYSPPALDGPVTVLLRQTDGKVLVGGQFSRVNGKAAGQLMRLTSDLTVDTTFAVGQGFDAVNTFTLDGAAVRTLAVQPDGKILVGGNFSRFQGVTRKYLVRLNANGTFDPTFAPAAAVSTGVELVRGAVRAIHVQADGKVVVGGTFAQRLVRLEPNGALDSGFAANLGSGFNSHVYRVRAAGGDRLWVAGEFTAVNGANANRVARLNADGTLDSGFAADPAVNGWVTQLEEQSDGRIIVAGENCPPMRLNATGTLDANMLYPTAYFYGAVTSLLPRGGDAYFVGVCVSTNSDWLFTSSRPAFYSLNAAASPPVISPLVSVDARAPTLITQVAAAPGGRIYAAGLFHFVDGTMREGLVRLLSTGQRDTSFNPTAGSILTPARFAIQGDQRVVVLAPYTQRLNSDGTRDPSYAVSDGDASTVLCLDPFGRAVVARHDFTVSKMVVERLTTAGVRDTAFTRVITGASSGLASALAAQPDGKILVGGSIFASAINGENYHGIARLTSTGSRDTSFAITSAALDYYSITAIAVLPDGKILVGRDQPNPGVASLYRVNSDGTVDSGFNAYLTDTNTMVSTSAIVLLPNGKILRGGDNSSRSGPAISRHLANGPIDATFQAALGPNVNVRSFDVLDDGRIIVGTSRGLLMLKAGAAPMITTDPVATTAQVGETATLEVDATGGGLSYQWKIDGTAIPGATARALTLAGLSASNAGSYTVTVSNFMGSVTSSSVTLTVSGLVAIATAPASRSVGVGGTTVFSVGASSTLPLSYQWTRNGAAIAGATGATHTIAPVTAADAGAYTATVRTSVHAAATEPVTLTVLPNPIAYSGRQFVGPAGVHAFFSIDGTQAKRVLLRVLGPTLASHGVSGVIGDPAFVLLDAHGRNIAANDNWAELGATAAGVFAAVGASPLPAGSADAAIVATLAPGSYAVRIHGVGGATGVALLELFDTTTNPRSRLGYVAVRGRVEAAGGGLAAGLTITNSAPKRLLVRAVGASAGGAGAHPDPQLQLLEGNVIVAQNDNWVETTEATGAATQAGAFALLPGGKDAAILINERVGTGAYTAQVPATGSAGDVLLEFYDVPVFGSSVLHPLVVGAPVNTTVSAGGGTTLAVAAIGQPPLAYQWRKDGVDVPGATSAALNLTALQPADGGSFDVLVGNALGTASSRSALVTVGTQATHAVAGPGYIAGRSVTVTNVLSFTGTATGLGWQVTLPAGWTYATSAGNLGSVLPPGGAAGTLAWTWATVPASPVVFSYTVNVPAGETGTRTIAATASVQPAEGTRIDLTAAPAPLTLAPAPIHSADTDADFQLGLLELTRVIELYNTRNGTQRTGAYRLLDGTEDGFAADPTRAAGSVAALARYHSADTAVSGGRDGRIDLGELTRVIQLYNFRAGTTRTGQYHADPANLEDGFAPGP